MTRGAVLPTTLNIVGTGEPPRPHLYRRRLRSQDEAERRSEVLRLLYRRRQAPPDQPSLGLRELEACLEHRRSIGIQPLVPQETGYTLGSLSSVDRETNFAVIISMSYVSISSVSFGRVGRFLKGAKTAWRSPPVVRFN